jgi:hypothetical protein
MSYNDLRTIVREEGHEIMEYDTHSRATDPGQWQLCLRAGLALVGLVTIGTLAAACGGGSGDPGAASVAKTTTTTTSVASSGSSGSGSTGQTSQSQELQLAQCMRSHGVPNFPDPSTTGNQLQNIANSGVNTHSTTYQAALSSCKKYTPAGNLTPAQSAAANAKGLEFSQCMRSHGVPNFPDPTTGPTGAQAINMTGLGIDLNSPTFQAANAACQKIVPGSK